MKAPHKYNLLIILLLLIFIYNYARNELPIITIGIKIICIGQSLFSHKGIVVKLKNILEI